MSSGYKFYRACYYLVNAVFAVVYPMHVIGKENIPNGAGMVCANHSSNADPFLIALAFGIDNQMHIIAKIELFKIPVVSQLIRKLGMISVDRGILDATTIKTTLRYLKNNEKVVIFPEGTRVSKDDAASAKAGAVKLAERAGVPLVPVFLPRKKPVFRRVPLIIGEPYYVEKPDVRRSADDYDRLSANLMAKIKALAPVHTDAKPVFGVRR